MKDKKIENKLVPYQKKASLLLESAGGLTIKTVDEIESASDVLLEISTVQEKIKAERERLTKPAKEIISWAKSVFDPIENQYKEAERLVKSKMLDFDKRQEEKNKKKLAKIAEKVASGDLDIDKAGEKINGLTPVKSYSGEIGGIQLRNTRKPIITDLSKLPRKYLKPDSALIRKDLFNGVKIPGAELIIEKSVAKNKI